MAHSKDLVQIAYAHLSKVSDVKGVLLCCCIYGKWMSFKDEIDFIDECSKKIQSFLDEKKKGG